MIWNQFLKIQRQSFENSMSKIDPSQKRKLFFVANSEALNFNDNLKTESGRFFCREMKTEIKFVWLISLAALTRCAIVPPPWADPTKNPCANQPRGWQLVYWPDDGKCYKIYQVSFPKKIHFNNNFNIWKLKRDLDVWFCLVLDRCSLSWDNGTDPARRGRRKTAMQMSAWHSAISQGRTLSSNLLKGDLPYWTVLCTCSWRSQQTKVPFL